MRKILTILVSVAYALVMQMPFVHALDMGMELGTSHHSEQVHTLEHDGALCDTRGTTNTQSCFNGIPESKWIEAGKKIEITLFFFASIFVFFISLATQISPSHIQGFLKRIILYQTNLYLGLFGIIRNLN